MSDTRRTPVVAVTQAEGRGASLVAALEGRGIRLFRVPVIAHEPVTDSRDADAVLDRLADYHWVLFTSANAVESVRHRPAWRRWPWTSAPRPRIGAVGPSTAAALASSGIPVAVRPADASAMHLASAVIDAEGGAIAGKRVLWPRSAIARPELGEVLRQARAIVVDPVVYHTTPARPPNLAAFESELRAGRIDAVTFLSPSSATHLAAVLPGGTLAILAGRTVIASVGPTTSAALRDLGAAPSVEAQEHSG
ncbi:MAG: uroporphyrinogen-III synthase, partial [Acidobacteria bacterium]|nr:uroporphyrinogen-III synthase [Acidobacteriota bacterium]